MANIIKSIAAALLISPALWAQVQITKGVQVGGAGATYPLPSGTGIVAVNGGTGALATPAQVVTALGYSAGSQFFGDSTTCATGATSTTVAGLFRSAVQNGYPGLLMPIIGADLENNCYSGVTQTDINNLTFDHADNEGVGSPTIFGEGGINDASNANATAAGYQNSFKYGLQGRVLFGAIPRANKVFAQDAGVTTTGTWTNDTAHQYGWGKASTVNGSTFSCPAAIGSDGHGIVWALQQDGNAGTWTGSWSGTGGGSLVDPVTSSTTFTAAGYGGLAIAGLVFNSQYAAYIYSGLSAGTHTFTGTVTSATGAGNVVDFGGCAGLPASNVNLPWDFEAGVPYQNSGTGGAPDSTTAAFNTLVSTVATAAAALPLNVSFVDVRNTLLNAPTCGNGVEATMFTNCYSDFKHQNNTGYAAEVNTATTGYNAVATTANPFLTMGAVKDPRKGPMNQYPDMATTPLGVEKWFNVNASNRSAAGYGITFNCANGGLNCSGIGNLANYNTAVVMGGGNFNVVNCPGYLTPINVTGCTQFLTAQPNGSMYFFGTGGNSGSGTTGYDYFTSSSTYLGGFPGYLSGGGVFLTATTQGVATQGVAVSGTNFPSPNFRFRGASYTSSLNTPADVYLYNAVGTGPNPTMALTLGSQYSTGNYNVDFSSATGVNKLGSILVTSCSGCATGSGTVTTSGTPANLQLALFSGASVIGGSSALVITGTVASPTAFNLTVPVTSTQLGTFLDVATTDAVNNSSISFQQGSGTYTTLPPPASGLSYLGYNEHLGGLALSDNGHAYDLICTYSNPTNCPASTTPSFAAIVAGTNTTAAMVLGSGSSMTTSGTGSIGLASTAATLFGNVGSTFYGDSNYATPTAGATSYQFLTGTGATSGLTKGIAAGVGCLATTVVETTTTLSAGGCIGFDRTGPGGFHLYTNTGYTTGSPNYTQVFQVLNNGNGVFNGTMTASGVVAGIAYSAAGTPLPTCASATRSETTIVLDATSPTYFGAYTSGGLITAPVVCTYNGTTYSWVTY